MLTVAAWLGVVAVGVAWQIRYETKAGSAGSLELAESAGMGVPERMREGRIVMALHPRCPCSGASVANLAEVARRARPGTSIRVLAGIPLDARGEEWLATPNCEAVRAIPGVELVADPGGRLGALHGLTTSGHVLAYDAGGALRFSGGITESRGNPEGGAALEGLVAILETLQERTGERGAILTTPVFGCEVVGAEAGARRAEVPE